MEYERSILILDGLDGGLQGLALKLMNWVQCVHYANDPDEAQLLALEERGRIGAILISSTTGLSRVSDLARRFGVAPAALVPTGDWPVAAEVARWAERGARWHLWGDPEEEAIRFVLSSIMSEQDPFELRFFLRAPTNLAGTIEIGEIKGEVTLCDISLGGSCVLGEFLGREGDIGSLRFSLGDAELHLPVHVSWSSDRTGDGVQVTGLSFVEVDPESGQLIDAHVDSIVGRQRIKVPKD